eukprot:PhF_6_TR35373/c0_g1_i1/m.51376
MSLPQDKTFDEIQAHSQNFETYDKQFTEVLLDLEGDDMLETFRREYDQLHMSFVKSHEGEKRLIKKCQDLQIEIVACQYKIRTAEDLSLGDKTTIDALSKEIVKAKQKFEQSKETEITLKEKIKQLKSEIRDLDKQIEKGVSGAQKHEATLQELNRYKRELQKNFDGLQTHFVAINHEINFMKGKVEKVQTQKDDYEAEIRRLRDKHGSKEKEVEKHKMSKSSWDNELKSLKEELVVHQSEAASRASSLKTGKDAITRLEEQIAQQREEFEKQEKEYAIVNKKSQQLEQELYALSEINAQESTKLQTQQQQVKHKEAELSGIRREIEKVARQLEVINRTNASLEAHKAEIEEQKNKNKFEIQRLEQELSAGQRYCDNDRKQIEDLKRERDILNKSYLKVQGGVQRERDWVSVKENQLRNLEHQLKGYERHAQKQRELIHQLEKETNGYIADGVSAAQKYLKELEGLRTQDIKIGEQQRLIHEEEIRLKTQQSMYEAVHNERNLFSKQLLDLNAQIVQMDQHLDIIEQQIGQLKDEITQKDEITTEEQLKSSSLEKDKGRFSMDIKRYSTQIQQKDRKIASLNHQINKLNLIIAEADAEKCKQHRDCENVTNERDILGMQLIRRNDELAQLYERIRIQQSALKKGEAQYRNRMIELRQFEEKMRLLRAQLISIRSISERLPSVRTMLNKVTKDLNRARLKSRTLLDECENPTNVHRWNKMKGSQPATYKLHKHMRDLQAQLIEKQEEVQVKVQLIREKEQLYVELKSMLARQPGPEVAEQLNVYQDTVAKKSGQLKAMKESLHHFEQQLAHHESRYTELTQAMKSMRSSYKQQRKRQKLEDERQRLLAEIMGKSPSDMPAPRTDDVYVGHSVPPLPPRDRGPTGSGDAALTTAAPGGDETTGFHDDIRDPPPPPSFMQPVEVRRSSKADVPTQDSPPPTGPELETTTDPTVEGL